MIPDLSTPCSQLFLSCDLTGSTDFKQKQAQDPEKRPWQKIFLQFYRDFPQQLAFIQREDNTDHLTFDLWKPVGDELIYSCEVRSEDDVYQAVRTWVKAMEAYRLSSLAETTMGTKGGAFIATFPGPDSRSSIRRDPDLEVSDMDPWELNRQAYAEKDHAAYLYDYYGPSIDTGFRVTSLCKPRYFTLSVEVALAMITSSKIAGNGKKGFHVRDFVLFDFVELKGVWGNRPYPVIAIDLEADDPVNEAYEQIHPRGSRDELLNLCHACYTTEDWPFQLYLPDSKDGSLQDRPIDKLDNVATTRPEGVERKAEDAQDEPPDAAELGDNVPLGQSNWRVGTPSYLIPESITYGEAEAYIRNDIDSKLDPGEYISRFAITAAKPVGKGEVLYTTAYGTLKGQPTDSTAPTSLPGYQPHPFDNA